MYIIFKNLKMISKAFIDKLDQNILAEDNLDFFENFTKFLNKNCVKNSQKRTDKLIFNWNIHASTFGLSNNILFKKLTWDDNNFLHIDYRYPFNRIGIHKIIGMFVTTHGPKVVIAEKTPSYLDNISSFYDFYFISPKIISSCINFSIITFEY